MKTERRSPMTTSGVATPNVASNNIAVVITTAATNPASKPARIAFARVTMTMLRAKWRKKMKLHARQKPGMAVRNPKASRNGNSPDISHAVFGVRCVFASLSPRCTVRCPQRILFRRERSRGKDCATLQFRCRENLPCAFYNHG
jgi:hypothetical protein